MTEIKLTPNCYGDFLIKNKDVFQDKCDICIWCLLCKEQAELDAIE